MGFLHDERYLAGLRAKRPVVLNGRLAVQWTDGGEWDAQHTVANLLTSNAAPYCTAQYRNSNIHVLIAAHAPFLLTHIIIHPPKPSTSIAISYHAPAGSGLVWTLLDAPGYSQAVTALRSSFA